MSLRDKVSKLFPPQKPTLRPERPQDAWKSARVSPEERKAAEVECEKQLRAFDEKKAASARDDLAKERQKAALQHPEPKLTPSGTSQLQHKSLIEKRATQALERKNQQERREIEQKPVHRLVADAKMREARESAAEKARGDDRPKGSETTASEKAAQRTATRDEGNANRHEPAEMQERPTPADQSQKHGDDNARTEIAAQEAEITSGEILDTAVDNQEMPQSSGWASAEERDSAIAAEREAREARDSGYHLDPGREIDP